MNTLPMIGMFVVLLMGLWGPVQGQRLTDDAQLRSSDIDIPATIRTGQDYEVRVKVKNVGTTTWQPRQYFLKIRIVRGPSGSSTQRDELAPYVELKNPVAPGEWHTFHYRIEGPSYVGTYQLEWVMSNGRDEFGDDVREQIRVIQ